MTEALTCPDPTATVALKGLLPGYQVLGHGARSAARLEPGVLLGDALPRELVGRADAAGVPIGAVERAKLQASCRAGGHGREWRCPVPLTQIDSQHYPVGRVMPPDDPGSLVIWLRPPLEVAYLRSVAELWTVITPLGTSSGEPELARSVTLALAWGPP